MTAVQQKAVTDFNLHYDCSTTEGSNWLQPALWLQYIRRVSFCPGWRHPDRTTLQPEQGLYYKRRISSCPYWQQPGCTTFQSELCLHYKEGFHIALTIVRQYCTLLWTVTAVQMKGFQLPFIDSSQAVLQSAVQHTAICSTTEGSQSALVDSNQTVVQFNMNFDYNTTVILSFLTATTLHNSTWTMTAMLQKDFIVSLLTAARYYYTETWQNPGIMTL